MQRVPIELISYTHVLRICATVLAAYYTKAYIALVYFSPTVKYVHTAKCVVPISIEACVSSVEKGREGERERERKKPSS